MKISSFPKMGKLTLVTSLLAVGVATGLHAMNDVAVASSTPPLPVYQANPTYSVPMRYDQVHGSVKVSFLVDSEGNVRDPIILRTDDARLSKSALAAVRIWKFKPARKNGEPLDIRVVQTINFPVFDPAGR
jgi:protein TonB